MFVDPAMLDLGGNEASRAGEHAGRAAGHLSRKPLGPLIFGDFAAAEAFHHAAGIAHAHHLRTLLGHREIFDRVSGGAHLVAAGFAEMDAINAGRMRALQCDSAT